MSKNLGSTSPPKNIECPRLIKGFEFLGEILQLKIPPGHDF